MRYTFLRKAATEKYTAYQQNIISYKNIVEIEMTTQRSKSDKIFQLHR